ncbi:c-type cytochrome [Chitinophaga sp. RAB17]|uniref:c-type cytochrome n=1 Tax=Chitinophaga sp. RAB17 TaxID=3233049 RepID=UPI003F8F6AAF
MKQLVFSVLLISIIGNLHVNAQTKSSGAKTPPAKKAPITKPRQQTAPVIRQQDIDEGKQLLSKSDCLACHKTDTKLVGPAYSDVAKKYPYTDTNLELLSSKIIKGGSGSWGGVPMTPHPALQHEDVKKMVTYILSLKAK